MKTSTLIQLFSKKGGKLPQPPRPHIKKKFRSRQSSCLYDRIGGKFAVDAVVESLYERINKDSSLSYIFNRMDTNQLKQHQKIFLKFALGKSHGYSGRSISTAHRGLDINVQQWSSFCTHLSDTLDEFSFSKEDISDVMEIISPLKHDIVQKDPSIETVINTFYDEKVLKDDRLSPFFAGKGVNIDWVKKHQIAFFTKLLNGEIEHDISNISTAHKQLGITDYHWNIFINHLADMMQDFDFESELIDVFRKIVRPYKHFIVFPSPSNDGVVVCNSEVKKFDSAMVRVFPAKDVFLSTCKDICSGWQTLCSAFVAIAVLLTFGMKFCAVRDFITN